MTVRSRTKQVLAMLLPAGVLGISAVLATVQAEASPAHLKADERISSVAARLSEIRAGVSAVEFKEGKGSVADAAMLGDWPNFSGGFGWRNGGWGNGGWGNGGWRNGGWGNGGWHNWHNGGWGNGGGWHNWHNFWHNW